MNYETVIGLEVHAQLLTRTKIFCGCSTRFGDAPNTHTCPVCLGMPGALPVLNRRVVEYGLRLGLALGCRIERDNAFARKNYFYPDLPKGYQITQFDRPLCTGGALLIDTPEGSRAIDIERVHMEEDAGKNIHDRAGGESLVDYNRAGVPLLEIVSAPGMRSPDEAVAYLKELRDLLVYLEICDGNMEEGSLRCDANISLRPRGSGTLGSRTELKNLNSFRFMHRALNFEMERQHALLEVGDRVVPETLLWDERAGMTVSMRGKETSRDYRYFPEPDLAPVRVDESLIAAVRAEMPELPREKRARLAADYGLPAYDAAVLTTRPALADYFERCAGRCAAPKEAANWIMTEVLRECRDGDLAAFPVTPLMLADLITAVASGSISGKMAKEVFAVMARTGRPAGEIIAEQGLAQLSDDAALRRVVAGVLAQHQTQVSAYRAGKTRLLGFFVGEVMRETGGRANPALTNGILKEMLDEKAAYC